MKLNMSFLYLFLLIFLLPLYGCSPRTVEINNGTDAITVNIEIADSDLERTNGLMFRENLNEHEGMLFVFEDSQIRNFWMKNTLIPLDIIFISEDFKISTIEEAEPCLSDPCAIYHSQDNVKYVLEVNKGFTRINHINVGDRVRFV